MQKWVWYALGIWLPDKKICPDHSAPLDAFAAAYFAVAPRIVWKASRGFGGKTVMLAALSVTEAITLGAGVTLLGGSGEQATRVHRYLDGTDPNMADRFWQNPMARKALAPLIKSKNVRETSLHNRGYIYALMASQKSVRGPHPQRLRGDEIDEMDQKIWDAAQGQPMAARGVAMQTLGSSTHQNSNGTMTHELTSAAEKGWPVFEWCYKETLQPHGWLPPSEVELKRGQVPFYMWETEYDLQEPEVEGRAVAAGLIDEMFSHGIQVRGGLGEKYEFEQPVPEGRYATGADWGKKQDKTIIITLRYDVSPARIVAFQHLGRVPWPAMIGRYNTQATKYPGYNAHDATGVGDVVDDYMLVETEGVKMVGLVRTNLFQEYIVAIENQEIISPHIEFMYREHKTCTVDDLYRGGDKYHPPDTFVAGAMAYKAAMGGGSLFY